MEPWEEHAIKRPHFARARHRVRGRAAGRAPERVQGALRRRARRVRGPLDRSGTARDRGRLVRLRQGDPAARRHRRGLRADPPGQRHALPGARPEPEGSRARARRRRARGRGLYGRFRDVQSSQHQRRRGRVDRAVPAGRARARRRRRSACAAMFRPRSAAPTKARSRPTRCARWSTSCSTCPWTRSPSGTRSAWRLPRASTTSSRPCTTPGSLGPSSRCIFTTRAARVSRTSTPG